MTPRGLDWSVVIGGSAFGAAILVPETDGWAASSAAWICLTLASVVLIVAGSCEPYRWPRQTDI